MVECFFCDAVVEDDGIAIDAGWIPSFIDTVGSELDDCPVCPECQEKYIDFVGPPLEVEAILKPGIDPLDSATWTF